MTITLYELAAAEDDRRFSPYCWRIRLALNHKGLEFNSRPWRLTEKDAIAFSGQGKVPVLVHDEHSVSDSTAIAFYLENAFPDRPSLFGGDAGRALARFVVEWTDQVLHPTLRPLILMHVYEHLAPSDQPYFRQSREAALGMRMEDYVANSEDHLSRFRQTLTPVRALLQHQPYLGGDTPLYADYTVLGAFLWARAVCPTQLLEADDPVAQWRDRMFAQLNDEARAFRFYPA